MQNVQRFYFADAPTQELVERVKNVYKTKFPDVRILIPIVNYLSKKEVLSALPAFVKIPERMKDVIARLLGTKPGSRATATSPSKLNNDQLLEHLLTKFHCSYTN